jgi:hypothetical protein
MNENRSIFSKLTGRKLGTDTGEREEIYICALFEKGELQIYHRPDRGYSFARVLYLTPRASKFTSGRIFSGLFSDAASVLVCILSSDIIIAPVV